MFYNDGYFVDIINYLPNNVFPPSATATNNRDDYMIIVVVMESSHWMGRPARVSAESG